MDTRPSQKPQGAAAPVNAALEQLVRQRLDIMKRHMPRTMETIEDRVLHYGPDARSLVRRALRGEHGCFYAIEGGYVMGTPMGMDQSTLHELGNFMVIFGCAHVCIWPERVWSKSAGGADGAD